MTPNDLLDNVFVPALGALILFVMSSIWKRVGELEKSDSILAGEIGKLSVLVAGEYAKREEVEKLGDAIFAKLDRIEGKLDKKVDR